MNVGTRELRTIPSPVYTLSPDGRTGYTGDFGRTNDMRPGYGYAGVPDPYAGVDAPGESGIWRVDIQTGETELILSLEQIAAVPWPNGDSSGCKHWVNHLLVSPDGSRLEFLQRWSDGTPGPLRTRMLTCRPDGSDLKVVSDSGHASHFIWRDPDHILVSCKDAGGHQMCLINVHTRELEVVDSDPLPSRDGHFSYRPHLDNEWLLDDGGGGSGKEGHIRTVVLYHLPSRKVVPVWDYFMDAKYTGPQRVDLHPRFSRDGTKVVVDAVPDEGRQPYLIDITGLATV